jgi:hypothetical protein
LPPFLPSYLYSTAAGSSATHAAPYPAVAVSSYAAVGVNTAATPPRIHDEVPVLVDGQRNIQAACLVVRGPPDAYESLPVKWHRPAMTALRILRSRPSTAVAHIALRKRVLDEPTAGATQHTEGAVFLAYSSRMFVLEGIQVPCTLRDMRCTHMPQLWRPVSLRPQLLTAIGDSSVSRSLQHLRAREHVHGLDLTHRSMSVSLSVIADMGV